MGGRGSQAGGLARPSKLGFYERLFFGQLQLAPPVLEFLSVLQLVELAGYVTKKGGSALALHPLHKLRL